MQSISMLLFDFLVCVVSFYFQRITNILGPEIHSQNIGKIHLVQFDSEGVFGWIPTQYDIINQFLSGDQSSHVDECTKTKKLFVFCI